MKYYLPFSFGRCWSTQLLLLIFNSDSFCINLPLLIPLITTYILEIWSIPRICHEMYKRVGESDIQQLPFLNNTKFSHQLIFLIILHYCSEMLFIKY